MKNIRSFLHALVHPYKYHGNATVVLEKSHPGTTSTSSKKIATKVHFVVSENRWEVYIPVIQIVKGKRIEFMVSFDQRSPHMWMPLDENIARDFQKKVEEALKEANKSGRKEKFEYELSLPAA